MAYSATARTTRSNGTPTPVQLAQFREGYRRWFNSPKVTAHMRRDALTPEGRPLLIALLKQTFPAPMMVQTRDDERPLVIMIAGGNGQALDPGYVNARRISGAQGAAIDVQSVSIESPAGNNGDGK